MSDVIVVRCDNPACNGGFGCVNPEPWESDVSLAEDAGWIYDFGLLACSQECLDDARAAGVQAKEPVLHIDGSIERVPVTAPTRPVAFATIQPSIWIDEVSVRVVNGKPTVIVDSGALSMQFDPASARAFARNLLMAADQADALGAGATS